MQGFTYSYEIAEYRHRNYQIGVRADPSLQDTESFAVVLFYRREDGEVVEIAKIDNVEHRDGTIHIDRHYREAGAKKKDFDIDVSSWDEAEDYLTDHWKQFADRYEENHGTDRVA